MNDHVKYGSVAGAPGCESVAERDSRESVAERDSRERYWRSLGRRIRKDRPAAWPLRPERAGSLRS